MSARVVSLSAVRQKLGYRRWSNQDIAEIYRVADSLRRAGLPIESDEGQTDEGEPWYSFCSANTGEVIVHFAYIDGRYIAEVGHLGVSFSGSSLAEIIGQFLKTYPVVLPSSPNNGTRIWMHPSSGLVAFVATLYFLLEMSQRVDAREVPAPLGVDGDAMASGGGSEAQSDDAFANAYSCNRDPYARAASGDGGAWDGMRSVAVGAALLIAGVLMDWHRTSDQPITFDPGSALDKIMTVSFEELGDAIVSTLKSSFALENSLEGGSEDFAGNSTLRTAYIADDIDISIELGDLSAEEISNHNEDDGLIFDLDGEFGVVGRAPSSELLRDFGMDSAVNGADKKPVGSAAVGQGQPNDAATDSAAVGDGSGTENQASPDAPQEQGSSNFLDGNVSTAVGDNGSIGAAHSGSALSLFESLGLRVDAANTTLEEEFGALVQKISQPATLDSASDAQGTPATQSSVVSSPVAASIPVVLADAAFKVAGPASDHANTVKNGYEDDNDYDAAYERGSGQSDSASNGYKANSGEVEGSSTPKVVPEFDTVGETSFSESVPAAGLAVSGSVTVTVTFRENDDERDNSGKGSEILQPFDERHLDFSFFRPVDVLRQFFKTVEDVGFAEYDDVYYLYDAFAVATEPDELKFNNFELENGDEFSLIGQADTFAAIYDALA